MRNLGQCSTHITPLISLLACHPSLQGDGTAQLLCRDAAAQAAVCSILQADFSAMTCLPFTVPATGSSNGLHTGSSSSSTAAAAGLCANGSPAAGKAVEAVAVAAAQ